ncbi:alpha/beta fold hydrolase [Kitasatospora camelliae]|uniref:Alpha/beta hydrolase n=1 Tax=Kitasatospora camelliae TaxID=3156397 RepID=A0AAU8K6V2_9ACTN
MASTEETEEFDAWDIRESGPADAPHGVLLLPGGLCSTVFYEDVMAEPALADAPVRLVAATIPGFAHTPPPRDLSMENYAALVGALADRHGCGTAVGHSFGANILLEAAAAGHFSGPLVLLSPTFSRADEATEFSVADRIGRVPGVGALTWTALLRLAPRMMSHQLPEARREVLVADLRNNDTGLCRRLIRHYFDYLDRHGSLVPRLRSAQVPTWVVFGEHDEIGLAEEEVAGLDAEPGITLVTVPDSGHLLMVDQPALVAELIARVALGRGGTADPR